jgi:hypothetical protein
MLFQVASGLAIGSGLLSHPWDNDLPEFRAD